MRRQKTAGSSQQSTLLDKILPHNLDAEKAVLGCVFLNEHSIAEILEHVDDSCFYKDAHKKIFRAMMDLFDNQKTIDVLTISEELKKRGLLDDVGGLSTLTDLAQFVPSAANAQHYARIVKEKNILRSLIEKATEIIGLSYQEEGEIHATLDHAEQMIFEISKKRGEHSYVHIKDVIKTTIKNIDALYHKKTHITGTPTGLRDFDNLTAGLQRGDLIIVAGRPSMGKSAFVGSIAEHIAVEENQGVAFFSLEMSAELLAQRFLCSLAKIPAHSLRKGFISSEEWPHLLMAAEKLSQAPLFIDETPAINIFELRAKARRLKSTYDIKLLIVDYLQLIRGAYRAENRQQEISEISRALKALAKELNIPVIAVSQLSREVEKRQDHKPQLSDLRESGAIEQDADVVVFLFREEYYNPTPDNEGIAEVIVAKQRNGPTDILKLVFFKEIMSFGNLADPARMKE